MSLNIFYEKISNGILEPHYYVYFMYVKFLYPFQNLISFKSYKYAIETF